MCQIRLFFLSQVVLLFVFTALHALNFFMLEVSIEVLKSG